MSKKRSTYTPEFKSKVALAAVRQELTVSEIAAKYKVHSVNVTKWKSQLLERMTELFVDGRSKMPPADNDVNVADLLQKVGRLTMENDRLKKNLTSSVEQRSCLIDTDDELFNITQQCELFDVPRSSFYDEPVSMSAAELDLMEQFERFHFESPFYGSRQP